MNIFISNLSYGLSEADLNALFEEYGNVSSVRIIKDKETGRSRGFGFVEMDNDEEANQAIENLNGHELKGRNINVSEAKPRENNYRR
ncbi:MAG: RNA-binding protein [Capnocytophaga sp.]|nr:RNA-binding protein [Capnocytophaga sp.]